MGNNEQMGGSMTKGGGRKRDLWLRNGCCGLLRACLDQFWILKNQFLSLISKFWIRRKNWWGVWIIWLHLLLYRSQKVAKVGYQLFKNPAKTESVWIPSSF